MAVTVSNTVKKEGAFNLEWYFLSRSLDRDGKKGAPAVCEKNKTTLTIGGMKRVVYPIESRELTWSELNSSQKGKSFSGGMFEGYIILLKLEGEILAKYSNEKKFLSEEWIGRLEQPVVSGGNKSPDESKKKKRRKKSK